MYIRRQAEKEFGELSKIMRIVLITGPRQCGKTTMLRNLINSEKDICLSMDIDDLKVNAQEEPAAFLNHYLKKYERVAIDEAQKVPALIGQIKYAVDQDPTAGKIFLSGSSNYRSLPSVNESLAGRLGEVRLRTFTQAEIQKFNRSLIERIVSQDFGGDLTEQECSKQLIIAKAIAGGYPSLLGVEASLRRRWIRSYLTNIQERDLADIGGFRKKAAFDSILRRFAAVSSRTINFTDFSQSMAESLITVRNYFEALKTMFLIDEVPAWTKKSFDRMTKASKWELTDTALMAYLISHNDANEFIEWSYSHGKEGSDLIGNLVETFVYTQLAPLCENNSDWNIFHLRQSERREIDFILENERGDKILLEVKASENVGISDFDDIAWFQEKIAGNDTTYGIVLYCGQTVRQFGEHLWAIPIAKFWQQ